MAATSVLKLVVDDKEYSASLKNAKQGMQALQDSLQNTGKTFLDVDKRVVEYARALGQMETTSKSARGKIGEMSSAFVELSIQYKHLTDQEKQSPLGKAMSESLDTLKTRVIDAKQELADFENQLKDIGDVKIETPSGGLFGGKGLTDILAVAGGNLIATGISKLTSELTESVQQSIELARAGEGVRNAFERLNQPGLLDRLKEATHGTVSELELMKAAVKFEDFKLPVEQLGTLLAFAQKKAKDTGQSVDYMVDSIVTGLGRKSLMILDNLGLSASQVKDRMKETGDMTSAVASIIKEQMAEAGEYVETAADRAARAAADAQNQMEELGRQAMPVAEEFATAWNKIKMGGMSVINFVLTPIAESLKDIREILSGEYTLKIKAEYDTPLGSNVDDNGNYIKRPANGNWAGFNAENGTWKPGYSGAIYNSATGQTELPEVTVTGNQKKTTKKTSSTSTTKVPTYGDFEKFLNKSTFNVEKLKPEDYIEVPSVWEQYGKDIAQSMNESGKIISESMIGVNDAMNNLSIDNFMDSYDAVEKRIADLNKNLKEQKAAYSLAGQAAQNFGAALMGIEDPAAKAAGTVMQSIASITLGFSMASTNANTAGTGWGWLAWLAAGTAAMATTINTIHSLTGYAQGGKIKGNSYSGDNIGALVDGSQLVGLNAGEIVLNAAQQSNVASGLRGGAMSGMSLKTKVKGTELLVWIDNSLAQAGRGELVTWGQ